MGSVPVSRIVARVLEDAFGSESNIGIHPSTGTITYLASPGGNWPAILLRAADAARHTRDRTGPLDCATTTRSDDAATMELIPRRSIAARGMSPMHTCCGHQPRCAATIWRPRHRPLAWGKLFEGRRHAQGDYSRPDAPCQYSKQATLFKVPHLCALEKVTVELAPHVLQQKRPDRKRRVRNGS